MTIQTDTIKVVERLFKHTKKPNKFDASFIASDNMNYVVLKSNQNSENYAQNSIVFGRKKQNKEMSLHSTLIINILTAQTTFGFTSIN